MVRSIFVTPLGTALLLIAVVAAAPTAASVVAFVLYSALQWMGSTACYTLLMNAVPETDRSAASAMTMFCNSLGSACAASAAGALLVHFHYAPVLLTMALGEVALAILFRFALQDRTRPVAVSPGFCARGATE